ncbi:beta-1,3-galactosyltransferase 5 [Spea bombifrons]|uniref:beta-1,3-galactosyltransferase 5 n=1 Tax=Spea bombifrons TaxID=233779 RepID=UPI00234A44C2|nr:beta-1,3-galactosyltransferase 5 [Spea bombifrons]XP_053311722.1 beta-1,3-galactosyltransferase 5 [Spea bombifrons]
MTTRQKVIVGTGLFLACMGVLGIFIEVQFLQFCTFCYPREVSFTPPLNQTNNSIIVLPKINCQESPPFLLLLVTTTHNQKVARMAIRNTWGKAGMIKGKRVETLFLLGASQKEDKAGQASLMEESNVYKDIIQGSFRDVYYNLTIKTLMGIEWIHHFCPQTSFAMKTDTDVFVNTPYLVDLLIQKNVTSDFFTGFLKMNDHPVRNSFSKWYISQSEYPAEDYPPFCSGTGYVFSVDVALKIHDIMDSVPFFKLEDVYVGLCLDKLQITVQELHTQQTFFPWKKPFSVCGYQSIVTSHGVSPTEMVIYWEGLERSKGEKC